MSRAPNAPWKIALAVDLMCAIAFACIATVVDYTVNESFRDYGFSDHRRRDLIVHGGTAFTMIATAVAYAVQRWRIRRLQPRA